MPAIASGIVVITLLAGCGSESDTPSATASPTASKATASAAPTQPTPTPQPTSTPAAVSGPVGYPLEPGAVTGLVVAQVGRRTIDWTAGPAAADYSTRDQVADDAERANAAGWNCRVHVEYEGSPAVDWYVPEGSPVLATMDGTATLLANTLANAFDFYGLTREPYLGNPDRVRAPINPFPGPGGGMGLYISVTDGEFRTDYGHLSEDTLDEVPPSAFAPAFSAESDLAARYSIPRPLNDADIIATWKVRRGDVIGVTGDSGYSEAPHLHYQITRLSDGQKLCPTAEPGFADGGWLSR